MSSFIHIMCPEFRVFADVKPKIYEQTSRYSCKHSFLDPVQTERQMSAQLVGMNNCTKFHKTPHRSTQRQQRISTLKTIQNTVRLILEKAQTMQRKTRPEDRNKQHSWKVV